MTYFILDKEGFVCDLGNIAFLDKLERYCPKFVETGETSNIEEFAKGMEKLDRPICAGKIRKAKPPLMITDGMVEEERVKLHIVRNSSKERNPCHNPPGSPEGGKFCTTPGSGGDYEEVVQKAKNFREYRDRFDGWIKKLTKEEKKSIYDYYVKPGPINDALRNKSKDLPKDVANLDSALAKSVLDKGVTVYRGIGGDMAKNMIGNWKSLVGKEYLDLGFTSASLEFARADFLFSGSGKSTALYPDSPGREFLKDGYNEIKGWVPKDPKSAVTITLKIPAGTKAGIIDKITHGNEKELLISRGGTYRIISTGIGKGKYYVNGNKVEYPKYFVTMEKVG